MGKKTLGERGRLRRHSREISFVRELNVSGCMCVMLFEAMELVVEEDGQKEAALLLQMAAPSALRAHRTTPVRRM